MVFLTLELTCWEWASGIFPFYLPVYCFPFFCFLCESVMVDVHVAERKYPLQCVVTACHCKTPQLATIVLFSSVWDKQAISVLSLTVTMDVPHKPWPSSIEGPLCLLVIVFRKVKPSPQSDNARHSEYRELSIDSAHLTMTFSNLKYGTAGLMWTG